jgi:Cu-processing system ATP-binding protein
VIAFRAVTKHYGAIRALERVTFACDAGGVVALLGPNGSGKTTALKAAAGLITPTSGEVVIGPDAQPAANPAARRALSFLPQKVLFPDALTGREVVEFYGALRGAPDARVAEVLSLAALNGAGSRTVATYSGGMVQRLGLAVALLPDAPVLLLDEPTAALDPDGLAAFYNAVEQRKAAGRTVLFTSHQLGDTERLADRFAVLVGGRLVAMLTREELSDRLAARGVLKLRIPACPPELLAQVRDISPGATVAGDQLVVPGAATLRPQVIDIVRASRVEIRGLTAEEGRLDALYRELVGAAGEAA